MPCFEDQRRRPHLQNGGQNWRSASKFCSSVAAQHPAFFFDNSSKMRRSISNVKSLFYNLALFLGKCIQFYRHSRSNVEKNKTINFNNYSLQQCSMVVDLYKSSFLFVYQLHWVGKWKFFFHGDIC